MINRIVGSALDYTNTVKENFPHRTKLWEFLPQGSFQGSIGSSDIVRFNPKCADFWDPYSTFMDITVDIKDNTFAPDDTTIKNKLLQVDSSAQSFFSQLVIYDNNEELERIMQYDTLACMLKDITSDVGDRYAKDYEGLGGSYSPSFCSTVTSVACRPNLNDGAVKALRFWQPTANQFTFLDSNNQSALGENRGTTPFYTTSNHVSNMTQSAWQPYFNKTATTWSANTNTLDSVGDFAQVYAASSITTSPEACGLYCPYTPAFGSMGYEPVFSASVNQRYISQGLVKADKIQSANFQVPLMSAIFGHLLPLNCYKLIPMQFFGDLVFEFTLNPYALFTSFMNSAVAARGYTVRNIKMRTELVSVSDPIINQAVIAQYQQGIRIPTQQWSMGPLFPISNGQVPPTLQINLGFESLRDILFCFMPNDFTANSGCRKQYRLSMNITSMQLKVGTEYYPQIAVQGNAGNNLTSLNNNEFIKHLWKSFGKHVGPGNSTINPHNFAVNCRAFDPSSTDVQFTGDAQVGHFEENRVIGKACFSLNLDALNYENKLLSGLSTQFQKPFELLLNYDSTKTFPRAVTMYTFFRHDVALVISPAGNKVYGRN